MFFWNGQINSGLFSAQLRFSVDFPAHPDFSVAVTSVCHRHPYIPGPPTDLTRFAAVWSDLQSDHSEYRHLQCRNASKKNDVADAWRSIANANIHLGWIANPAERLGHTAASLSERRTDGSRWVNGGWWEPLGERCGNGGRRVNGERREPPGE